MSHDPADDFMRRLARDPEALCNFVEYPTVKFAREIAQSPEFRWHRDIASAAASAGALDHLKFTSATREAAAALSKFSVQQLPGSILEKYASIGEVTRACQWASKLSGVEPSGYGKLFAGLPAATKDVTSLREMLDNQAVLGGLTSTARMSALDGLDVTTFKMSAIAGIADVWGTHTTAWDEAYRSLLGTWRTSASLPEAFWNDPAVRRKMYGDAAVDEALADADVETTISVAVESGLAQGGRIAGNLVAVVAFANVSMTISSHNTREDAFRLIGAFEQALRALIVRKLSAHAGQDWFNLRVDGNIATRARRARLSALQANEERQPLIDFTEFGELAQIVSSNRNWQDVFSDIFINKDSFNHDMNKLIAGRRPTMHTRPIDGVRVVELMCVINRLNHQIEDDGHWRIAAEEDQ